MIVKNSIRSGKWNKGIVTLEKQDTPDSLRLFIDKFIREHGDYVILDLIYPNGKTDKVVIDGSTQKLIFMTAWKIRGRVSNLR
jgi:hypothetical protein